MFVMHIILTGVILMKYICLIVLTISMSSIAKQPNELMLMGTFHFENPGLDTVKIKTINVMTKESQDYLIELSKNISQFKPTIVLLEFNPANTEKMNEKYQNYLNGTFELPANEIYQIGFRVAKLSGVKRIESLDERKIHWQAEELFKYLETKDLESHAKFKEVISEVTSRSDLNHKTLPLKELLLLSNDKVYDQTNKNIYFSTNAIGVENGTYLGADSSASWWHRNFRIYAKIQHYAKTHTKIFALAGQGHTAILKDFIASDNSMNYVQTPF